LEKNCSKQPRIDVRSSFGVSIQFDVIGNESHVKRKFALEPQRNKESDVNNNFDFNFF
jgi:hypothetical protein